MRRLGIIIWFVITLSTLRAQEVPLDQDSTTESERITQQEGGSKNSGRVFYFYERSLQNALNDLYFIDTASFQLHRYLPTDRDNIFRANLGNIGKSTQWIEHDDGNHWDLMFMPNPFANLRFNMDLPLYQGRHPYTVLHYVMGAKREQYFDVLHAQNVAQGFNIGAQYRVINSPGYYSRSYSKVGNLRVFTNYVSPSERYRMVASYFNNQITNQESGGLAIDTDSLEYTYTNRNVVPMRLNYASQHWKENAIYMKHIYQLGRIKGDSIKTLSSWGYLSYEYHMEHMRRDYTETGIDPGYYSYNYFSDQNTFDSIFVGHYTHGLSYGFGDVRSNHLPNAINAILRYRYEQYTKARDWTASIYNRHFTTSESVHTLDAALAIRFHRNIDLRGEINWRLNDRYANDHRIEVKARYRFHPAKNNDGISISAYQSQTSAGDFEQHYSSNHYIWNLDLNKVMQQGIRLQLDVWGVKVAALFSNHIQGLRWTQEGPEQLENPYQIISAKLEKNFFWRFIRFDNRVVVQKSTDPEAIHLPLLLTRNALYADFVLLKKTNVQVGFEVRYHTKYYADQYNPALGLFLWQDKIEVGNFAFVDVFLNLRIQRAHLFVKLENLAAGWLGYNYSESPYYFMPERSIKFGVFWRFYD